MNIKYLKINQKEIQFQFIHTFLSFSQKKKKRLLFVGYVWYFLWFFLPWIPGPLYNRVTIKSPLHYLLADILRLDIGMFVCFVFVCFMFVCLISL